MHRRSTYAGCFEFLQTIGQFEILSLQCSFMFIVQPSVLMKTKEKFVRLDREEEEQSSYSIGLFIIPQFINDRHLTLSVLHRDDEKKKRCVNVIYYE